MAVNIDLSDQTALVTGGAGGIAKTLAGLFLDAGASVVLGDLNADAAHEAASEVSSDGRVVGVGLDIRSPESARAAVEVAKAEFGGLNILVNNAAVGTPKDFVDFTLEDYDRDVGTCLIGTMVMSQAAVPEICSHGQGRIVNMISDAARIGQRDIIPYGAAKSGLIGFTKGLARLVGRDGVTVNGVSPGTTASNADIDSMVESWGGMDRVLKSYVIKRLGRPADQAGAVLFFCSDYASWVTGQILSVSGGYTMAG